MDWSKIKIRSGLKVALFALVLFSAIGFVGKKQHDKVCTNIDIRIDTDYDNYFIDRQDVMNLITHNGTENITGVPFNDLKLKEIENRVKSHHFVEKAEVFKDLQGNLVINTFQSTPIARVVQSDGPDAYISDRGHVIPVSEKFTARVMVITGDYTRKLVKQALLKDSETQKIFDLLQFIKDDEFWNKQIVELDIDNKANITFFPQIGKQQIEFGKAEDIERKFKKLQILYKQILPQKGWNTYEKVNLKFNNQIICE